MGERPTKRRWKDPPQVKVSPRECCLRGRVERPTAHIQPSLSVEATVVWTRYVYDEPDCHRCIRAEVWRDRGMDCEGSCSSVPSLPPAHTQASSSAFRP